MAVGSNFEAEMIDSNETDDQNDMTTSNSKIILETLEKLRKKQMGQNLENVLKLCEKEYRWNREEIRCAIDEAKIKSAIEEVIVDGKISFRKFGQEVIFRGKPKPVSNKTADTSIAADYTDFKEHVWRELSVIKAEVTKNQLPSVQVNEASFITSLNERVAFLERQLDCKNQIIIKLVEQGNSRENGLKLQSSFDRKIDSVTSSCKTQSKPSLSRKQAQSGNAHSRMIPEDMQDTRQSDGSGIANKNTKQAVKKERKNIIVIGDSILNGIEERGLSKHHNVKVRPHPGATTRDIIDHVKPVARKRPDMLLIHCRTNDITNNIDTSKHLKEIVSTVREITPQTKIVLSAATIRRDRHGMEKKTQELNCKIKAISVEDRLEFLNNDNIDDPCLGIKGLHLNVRGKAVFAKNILSVINKFY